MTASTRTKGKRRRRRGWLPFAATVGAVTLLFPPIGNTHIVKEELWHPVPGAYLRSLFYARLRPVNWELIAREYAVVEEPGYAMESVFEGLAPAHKVMGFDHASAIRAAIDGQDAQDLYQASTRAVSQLTRFYIAEAGTKIREPGAAVEDVLQAQRIFRAFAGFIQQADPEGFARLGRAWLEMTTSAGSAGIMQIAGKASGPERFAAARKVIDDYLVANYEADSLAACELLEPVPERVASAGASYSVSPWLPPGSDLNDQDPLPLLRLNFEARGIDEKDLFLVAYGDMLFDSPEIFGQLARAHGLACATCHNRSDINQRFFIPGISPHPGSVDVDGDYFNPRSNDHRDDPLDIPTLRGIRFTAPYGRDGRFASLRDFTRNVVVNEFAGEEPTPLMLDALVTYLLEFDWLPSPYLNPDGTLNDTASVAARRGEELFTREFEGLGNRACSTCHIPSANFIDGLPHDLGSGDSTGAGARDSFFDTPTLINANFTAPYFHDGSLETLADVVDWFNERFELDLSKAQRADLTAYVEAAGDADEAYEIFDEENTRFRLDFDELSTFISTLDTLIPAQDAFHADLLIRTVATDLRLDASGLQDLGQTPMVLELADALDKIRTAILGEDWHRAAVLWEGYKVFEAEYGPELR